MSETTARDTDKVFTPEQIKKATVSMVEMWVIVNTDGVMIPHTVSYNESACKQRHRDILQPGDTFEPVTLVHGHGIKAVLR